MLARRAPVVRAGADRHGRLGREHDLRAAPGHRLAADLLRDRAAVGVGRVDEVSTRREVAVDQCERLALVAAPLRHAERHGTEAEIGDTEARAAERADAHVLSLIAEGCPACEPFGGWNHVACGPSSPPSGWCRRLDYQERDPRRPCTGAGAPCRTAGSPMGGPRPS